MTTPRPLLMGIVNMTPDSFSGDGVLRGDDDIARAVAQADRMIADGADLLDIGGESTRPGFTPVPVDEEIRRTAPVIAAIKKIHPTVLIAIDTTKAAVAAAAIQAGASIVNDITALAGDAAMGDVVAQYGAHVVLMHNRATEDAVAHSDKIGGHYQAPLYDDILTQVTLDLQGRVDVAQACGIAADKIILDPGVGFGKTTEQNLALIAHLDRFKTLGFPVLMGVSRKSFIGHTLDVTVDERLEGTAACVAACVLNGADIVRVHDVAVMARIVKMSAALRDA